MLTSQQQLADLAGVTRLTVHRALRNQPGVSEATRRRIRRLATDNGYRLNTAARAVVTGRHRSVALLSSTQARRSAASAALMSGIGKVLAERDLSLTLAICSDADLADSSYVPKIVHTDSADGLLINYTDHIPVGLIDAVDRLKLKAVWINTDRPNNTIRPDDRAAAERLTEYLLGLGHRRILYIDSTNTLDLVERHYSANHRVEGYRIAMQAAGLKSVVALRRSESEARESFLRGHVFDMPVAERPTAIISYGARESRPLVLMAAKLGLDIPGDLSLTAFGEKVDDAYGFPLTTAVTPDMAVGRAAAEAIYRLTGCSEPQAIVFATQTIPFDLIYGETVGATSEQTIG